MPRIGVRELRLDASRYLALVAAGVTVEVTQRGRLVALLVPPDGERTERDRLIGAGRLVAASGPNGRIRSAHPVPVSVGEPTNEELLDHERADSR